MLRRAAKINNMENATNSVLNNSESALGKTKQICLDLAKSVVAKTVNDRFDSEHEYVDVSDWLFYSAS